MHSRANAVRIIGGTYRGKKLSFPSIEGLRPTTDRIRETLFNWLMHDIRNARCLDAFAGSGALGFEAYSRGAAKVVLIEKNPAVCHHLQQIAASFMTPQLTVIQASAIEWLTAQKTNHQQQFDVVFIDPPFANLALFQCIQLFEQSSLLIEGGLLYLESPHDLNLDLRFWHLLKSKKTGQVTYALYQKKSLPI
ncbi:MAG: 16S rRNA (guanine(966)-N(2))-methyltransferase RsmD [Legionella sp.]|nr:MAG: 16S rRNA (guanine(966)-N(2))-methyltransferase RsmD [Legionella sp.]